ncbi:MAG: efflux RND transporter periplasmic adaptor subunit [Prevotellaceae bacterium]|jgi:RND family efflux transporter MFP subunit|nr:efflux RND transporter periplasmic adaptor subunit [Prevotellaceae bacterium]
MKTLKFLSLTVAAVLAFSSCGKKADSAQADSTEINLVKLQKMEKTTISRNLSFAAVLQAYDKVAVAPNIPGRIMKIYTDVGTSVSAGQLLVQMDKANYDQAKVTFDNLAVDYDRVSKLNESNNISKQQYDQTKASYEATQTKLKDLEANTFIRAPFAGVIEAKNYENGELYNGAQPILSLVQLHTLKTQIAIPESHWNSVKKGMPVKITANIFPGKEFAGTVDIIYPTIDPSTHTFQVQVKIPNGNQTLRPGMYADATISFGQVQAIVVPYIAVLKLQGSNERYVFVNNNGKAKRVSVKLGDRFDDQTEIISDDIKEGDELVVVGQARLNDGVAINVDKGTGEQENKDTTEKGQ